MAKGNSERERLSALEEVRGIMEKLNTAIDRRKACAFGGLGSFVQWKKDLEEQAELLKIENLPMGSKFCPHPDEGKPYPNEHACRLKDPGDFERFARKNCWRRVANKCVDWIFGIAGNKAKVQAYRYKLKDNWTAAAAKAHCKRAGGTFEAASGKEGQND